VELLQAYFKFIVSTPPAVTTLSINGRDYTLELDARGGDEEAAMASKREYKVIWMEGKAGVEVALNHAA